jgi:hypothetical protein
MTQIKKLVDRITLAEGRQSKDVVIPLQDAKELRDELLSILLDKRVKDDDQVIEVVMKGGKW